MTVGERIKITRESKGISQTELANNLKISKQNLYKYENNIITNIPSDKIEAIATQLDVSPAYLMGWSKQKEKFDPISLTDHEASIGKRIKARREELGLTQEELGNTLCLNKSTIQRYEAGKVEKIKIPILIMMAKALDVNPDWLALKTNTMKPFSENFNFADEDEINADNFNISDHEKNVITAYRSKPEMQPAVDKLLGVETDSNTVTLVEAARTADNCKSIKTTQVTQDELEIFNTAPQSDEKL